MWRPIAIAVVFSISLLLGRPTVADEPATKVCPTVETNLGLRPEEEQAWSVCEKWVWSCLREGKEANLYEKACFVPRSRENSAAHEKWRYEPFANPDGHGTNLLSDQFLRTVLWQEEYSKRIPPHGVRIFGAYFKDPVNLENVATSTNLVIDGSVFKRGIRLTNYSSPMNLSFDGSNVSGPMLLLRTKIGGSLFLQRGVYDTIDLRDARIGSSIDAARSVFTDDFRMDRAYIQGKVNLVKSRLTVLNAWDTVIGGSLELRLADVRLRVDMTGATVNGDVRLQRVAFGRRRLGEVPSCDWDTSAPGDYLLSEFNTKFGNDPPALKRLVDETVLKRPALDGRVGRSANVCDDLLKEARLGAKNEVLLRDMKIKGNLCLIDLTGMVQGATGREHVDIISLDGTQANSTVLRWKDSPSETLWRAVNFKTSYMLVNLESQPKRHFIDNMDVGFIAFVKTDTNEPIDTGDEDVDKYLCDVTPAPENVVPTGSRNAHERLVRFFTGPANESKSAQPFSKIVGRLEESGATSTYLKTHLSEYRLAKVCTTSAFSKEWSAIDKWDLPSLGETLKQSWHNARKNMEVKADTNELLVEGNRLLWDGVCSGGMVVYKYAVSYGHEPYNLFYYAILFIVVFWLLLKLDSAEQPNGAGKKKLGLSYAVDTFVPLAQLRLGGSDVSVSPNSRLLRLYLRFHRFAGIVFAILVFLFIYRAAR
jgi:hypothetical protein